MNRTIRNSYYAYKLIDPRNNQPFYVGKGYGTRMYSHKTEALKDETEWTNSHKCRKIRKIIASGQKIRYEYILCETEELAVDLENDWISDIGLENLTNIVDAGHTANPTTKPIDVYDVKGNFIDSFVSTNAATRELGVSDEGIIRRCLNNYDKLQTYRGLVFVYRGKPFNYKNQKIKMVVATSDTETLMFDGTSAAATFFNRSKSCIRQCCKNGWKVDNFILEYAEE